MTSKKTMRRSSSPARESAKAAPQGDKKLDRTNWVTFIGPVHSEFEDHLVREIARGGAIFKSLRQAAEMLWCDLRIIKGNTRFVRACMREIDEKTKGAPYRLETPIGPVFLDIPLWIAAGRSGGELGDKVSRSMRSKPGGVPQRPTWIPGPEYR